MNISVVHLERGGDLSDAYEIRRRVFQEGQGIPETNDFDNKDAAAEQFVAYEDDVAIATARCQVLPDGVGKVQRVATLPEHRGKHAATAIMGEIQKMATEQGLSKLILDSQNSPEARALYEKAGYLVVSEPFQEVGIEHVKMVLDLE